MKKAEAGIRLQKVLADAGVASRRHAEEMIAVGRVRVNDHVVTEMGVKVNPTRDRIAVDGKAIAKPSNRFTYIMLNKPPRVITSVVDPEGRPTVMEYLRERTRAAGGKAERLYPVGRLDFGSEGLVLLTNDGELANRLAHPRFEHEKEYRVLVNGQPNRGALQRLRAGVKLEDGVTAPASVRVDGADERGVWLSIILREGRKHQVRLMCDAVGHSVRRLVRVRIGTLQMGDLEPGKNRALTSQEIAALKKSAAHSPSKEH